MVTRASAGGLRALLSSLWAHTHGAAGQRAWKDGRPGSSGPVFSQSAARGTALPTLGSARRPRSPGRTRCGSCAPRWAPCGSCSRTSTRWRSMTCTARSRSCAWSRWPVSVPRAWPRGPREGACLLLRHFPWVAAVSLWEGCFRCHKENFAWEPMVRPALSFL